MTREQGIEVLKEALVELEKTMTKEKTLAILLATGKAVGYSPTFRCLVAGKEPEQSIKWGN